MPTSKSRNSSRWSRWLHSLLVTDTLRRVHIVKVCEPVSIQHILIFYGFDRVNDTILERQSWVFVTISSRPAQLYWLTQPCSSNDRLGGKLWCHCPFLLAKTDSLRTDFFNEKSADQLPLDCTYHAWDPLLFGRARWYTLYYACKSVASVCWMIRACLFDIFFL